MLTFKRNGNTVQISNPSPYHVTLVQIALDGRKVENTMVAPFGTEALASPGTPRTITYSTINDYGAVSEQQRHSL
jgi:P pilus assembly chaperone PapD